MNALAAAQQFQQPSPHETLAYLDSVLACAHGRGGKLVLASFNDGMAPEIVHVPNDADSVKKIAAALDRWRTEKRNSYMSLALYPDDLPVGSKGEEKDIVSILGLVCDFDAEHNPATFRQRLPVEPSIVVETSAGNFQAVILFPEPVSPDAAKPIAKALAKVAGCDHCTSDLCHVWRPPGTWNRPNAKKIAEGRPREPQATQLAIKDGVPECIDTWEPRQTLDELRAAIETRAPGILECEKGTGDSEFDRTQRIKPREIVNDEAIIPALNESGDRSKEAFGLIVRLRRNGYSPEEVAEVLTRFSDMPVMGHYTERDNWEEALYADIKRGFEKPLRDAVENAIFRIENIDGLSDGAAKSRLPDLREIKVKGGSLSENVREAEIALIEQRVGIFQRGGMIVRPTEIRIEVRNGKKAGDLLLERVTVPAMTQHMTSSAKFVRWDARLKDWKPINCPREIVEAYLAGSIDWNLRVLSGIVNAPTLRSDGSLLDRPGYDETTGLLFDPRGVGFPPIPTQPTRDDARQALAVFEELISEFPFATREARAVALAGFLTVCIRRTLRAAPLLGIDGTGAGSGKGLLADIITIIGTGRPASPINTGANEEELEKRVASMMMRGDLVILVDNLDTPLESSFLCSTLTQETVSPRVLGQSKNLNLPTRHMFMATGNALTYVGDLNRRAITCLIDPKTETPSERVFDFDPIERATKGRPRYVAAALTILRAYQAADRPAQSGKVMGSYGEWCRNVRDALLWLGEADPAVTCISSNPNDPERERFSAVVTSWKKVIGTGRAVSAKQAADIASDAAAPTDGTPPQPELYEALQAVAAPMARGIVAGIDPRRLSDWLSKKKGLVVSGLRFYPDDKGNAGRRWRLEDVSQAGGCDDDFT